MQLKIEGDFAEYFNNKQLKIVKSHLHKVCLYGSGSKACRYIALTANGFTCMKNTPMKPYLDKEATNNPKWKAKGNNCDGFSII